MDTIDIPEEFIEEIQKTIDADEINDIKLEISKVEYDEAIKAKDVSAAHEAQKTGRALTILSRDLHAEKWAAIGRAVPETLEGRWTIDIDKWTVRPSAPSRNAVAGLGALFSSLGEAMDSRKGSGEAEAKDEAKEPVTAE